jgi:hypothetical protein
MCKLVTDDSNNSDRARSSSLKLSADLLILGVFEILNFIYLRRGSQRRLRLVLINGHIRNLLLRRHPPAVGKATILEMGGRQLFRPKRTQFWLATRNWEIRKPTWTNPNKGACGPAAPAPLKAIVEPDIYTAPVDRDRAIVLRWMLRDIKSNRLKCWTVNQHDLRDLIDMGLVEIQNDAPVLTNLGVNAVI